MPKPSRREFLKTALVSGCFFATAGIPRVARGAVGPPNRFHFPQGVASADPTPDSVVFWTRVESTELSSDPVDLTLEVSESEDFGALVLEQSVTAAVTTDYTVRVIVDGLKPDTRYFYRFRAGNDYSAPLGRTRTAPALDADREVRFAFVSCQNYEQGFFGAWRRMVADDEAAAEHDQIDFVLHLGDFIYERLHYFGEHLNAPWPEGPLIDRDGHKRIVPPFPHGGGEGAERPYAVTVEDYRHLYKTYLSDPLLQAARARWPFVSTWDDHEFTNNCWQSRSTYTREGAPAQKRKVAANQAWFEFVPAMLSSLRSTHDAEQPSRDFVPVEVRETDAAPFESDANNLAAIASLTIYRRLRFGKHVDLVITDLRSYRDDHVIPETLAVRLGGRDTAMLPVDIVKMLDAGRTWNGGNPLEVFTHRGREFPNPRKDAPAATVLGAKQKAWWKSALSTSDATWKLWANSIPMMPVRFDFYEAEPPRENSVLSADSWDGYPGERTELMRYLKEKGIGNVISLSGDHHMHFAGEVYDDFDGETPVPVAVEFTGAAISSKPTFSSIRHQKFLPKAFRDMAFMEVDGEVVELFNLTLAQGVRASTTAARSGDPEAGRRVNNPKQNPHLRYVDSASNGYGLARIAAEAADIRLVSTPPAPDEPGEQGPAITRVARFRVPSWQGKPGPELEGPEFEGPPPYPYG